MSEPVRPFKVKIDEHEIDDLRKRIRNARWPEAAPVDDWSQGVPLEYLQQLCAYWADDYDMQRVEERFNSWPQFETTIDGLDIHFVHARSPHAEAVPLIMTAGWPSSPLEFLDNLGPLLDPPAHGSDTSDAFHVVCPSLPGYGFSGKPAETGWNVVRTGAAWHELMSRLGYDRFIAQGSDWGGGVATSIARFHPEAVLGVHLDGVALRQNPKDDDADLTPFEREALSKMAEYMESGMGYAQIEATRPQTLGYGLVDSPVGQCAWIAEKFWAWTDGELETVVSRDELLDTVTLYWLTKTAASSGRMYWENPFARGAKGISAARSLHVEVPVGVSMYAGDVRLHSRRWVESGTTDLRFFEVLPKGGHFPAMEQPEVFVDQIRRSARTMRQR